jgi:hypothetical protein
MAIKDAYLACWQPGNRWTSKYAYRHMTADLRYRHERIRWLDSSAQQRHIEVISREIEPRHAI